MTPLYLIIGFGLLFLSITLFLVSQNRPQWLGLLVLLLFPFDNIFMDISLIRIRLAELLGLIVLFLFMISFFVRPRRIRLPAGAKVFIIFLAVSFAIVFIKSGEAFQRGIVLESHFFILFLAACSVFFFSYANINATKLQNIILKFIGAVILLGIAQFLLYQVLHWDLSFKERYVLSGNVAIYIQCSANSPESVITNIGDTPWYRPSSVFREAGHLGMASAWLYAVSLTHFLSAGSNASKRIKYGFYCLIALATAALTFARSSLMALIICTGVAILFSSGSRRGRSRVGLALALIILPLIFFPLKEALQKTAIIELAEERVSVGFVKEDLRMLMYSAQWTNFLDNPLFGIGPGTTEEVVRNAIPEEYNWEPDTVPVGGYSTVLTLLNDTGVAGFLLFLTIFVIIFAAVREKSALFKLGIKPESISWFNGLLAVLINGIFLPVITGYGFFWLALTLTWIFLEKDNLVLNEYRFHQPVSRKISHDFIYQET